MFWVTVKYTSDIFVCDFFHRNFHITLVFAANNGRLYNARCA